MFQKNFKEVTVHVAVYASLVVVVVLSLFVLTLASYICSSVGT